MKKILIVDDNEDILDILEMVITSEFENSVLLASSSSKAIEFLDKNQNEIGLIICDYSMPDGNGALVFNHNLQNENLPFFLSTGGVLEDCLDISNFESNSSNKVISKPFDEDVLISSIKEVFKLISDESCEDFKKVRISLIRRYRSNSKDIFLKISDNKFVKIINQGEFEKDIELTKYYEKGVEYCYMKSADFKAFTSFILDSIAKDLEVSDKISVAQASAIGFIHDQLYDIGIKSEQIEFVNAALKSTIDSFKKKSPALLNVMDLFLKEEGYLVFHSLTSIHIGLLIAESLHLKSDKILEKFIYTAIFHDSTLEDSRLSKVFDLSNLNFNELNDQEKKQVRNHTLDSVKLIEKFGVLIPPDVSHIILEHHERPDGSGFPRGLSSTRISSLAVIYILALKVADFLYYNKEADLTVLSAEIERDFSAGNFAKPSKALIDILNRAK